MGGEEFYKDFVKYAKARQKLDANAVLMKELGRIMVHDRENFIYVLKHAGLSVPDNSSDVELINIFVRNIPKNRTLLLGTSFLISHHNKMVSFDGEEYTSNICANAIQKSMHSYFDGDVFSYMCSGADGEGPASGIAKGAAGGGVVGAIAGALGEGAKFGAQVSANKGAKKDSSAMSLLAKQQEAKNKLVQSVIDQKKAALEKSQHAEKTKRTQLIVGGSIAGVLVIALGIGLYLKYRKK